MQFLPRDSALKTELVPMTDVERWNDGSANATILADLFDLVNQMRAEVAVKGTDHKPRRQRPYPRPGSKPKGVQHVGKDPIPVSEFESWWSTGR